MKFLVFIQILLNIFETLRNILKDNKRLEPFLSNVYQKVKKHLKILTVILAFILLILICLSSFKDSNKQEDIALEVTDPVWGPPRNLFTMKEPADYITFNSIKDNPVIGGDERNFVNIRKEGDKGYWQDKIKIEDGTYYRIRQYIHNNASSNLSLVAEGVRSRFVLPIATDNVLMVHGVLFSDNAKPQEIWDGATFYSDYPFNLEYIKGSAIIENNGFPEVSLLDDLINSENGINLGYDRLDGRIPGCMRYSAYVSFLVKATIVKDIFSLKANVKNESLEESKWADNVLTKEGDTISVKLELTEIDYEAQKLNLRVESSLLEYVPNSTVIINKSGVISVSDSIVTKEGLDVELFGDIESVGIEYKLKVLPSTDDKPTTVKNILSIDGLQRERVTYIHRN